MYEAYKKSRLRQFEGGGTGGEGDHNKTVDSNVDMDQGENSHANLDMDEFMKNNELWDVNGMFIFPASLWLIQLFLFK